MTRKKPLVLCFSGHDPSGGAGIQADIETISRHQCQVSTIITALTLQDSRNVYELIPQPAEQISKQADVLASDFEINVIKIGLLGHHEVALAVKQFLDKHPKIPVVFDPVLAAGGGKKLSNQSLLEALDLLLPLTTLITPNHYEARQLANQNSLKTEDIIACLSGKGCEYTLFTGADQATDQVINQLYHYTKHIQDYCWQRLPHTYHGSGCTLAATIAAFLASGHSPADAIEQAQLYTWNALRHGFQPGQGQHLPDRLYIK